MALTKVVLAKLSPTMEEGTIVKWNKNEGDPVKQGDVLAEIETDKANMEMEAQGSGILRKILVPAGGKAPVGSLIGVIADANEDISKMVASAGAPSATAAPPPAAPPAAPPPSPAAAAPPQPAPATAPPPPAQPTAAAPAPEPAAPAPPAAAPSPAPGPRAVPSPAAADGGRVKASPLARSMAAQRNIPLDAVAGSGPNGRIIKRDIESWAGAPAARRAPAPAVPAGPTITPGQEIPVSNMRKTIAKRLAESMFTAPHFYVTVDIDMDASVALREQLQRGEDVKVTYNDLVVRACAKALTRFPMVNGSWMGEKIVTHGEVHVGVAVTIPDGLITPVVRNADRKSVLDISREVKDLAARARERKLRPEEFTGSTFTISNLGMFGVSEFTAIINPPESAILAVGSVQRVPVADEDGSLRAGHRMKVTLSADHRVVDGAMAAQFLGEVRRLLENPVSLFV
ncbi:MAG TPA: pyruvate dehydrogenase complex dihydrolipoamide acetyltransferase [Vicinamibacteria bacterium]